MLGAGIDTKDLTFLWRLFARTALPLFLDPHTSNMGVLVWGLCFTQWSVWCALPALAAHRDVFAVSLPSIRGAKPRNGRRAALSSRKGFGRTTSKAKARRCQKQQHRAHNSCFLDGLREVEPPGKASAVVRLHRVQANPVKASPSSGASKVRESHSR